MSHPANGDHAVEADDLVPVLCPVEGTEISRRLKGLASCFASKHELYPDFFIRVPGRVNLIGEHIDYCGYAVCPMAIEQDILVAVNDTYLSSDNDIRLSNVDPKYEDFRCSFEDVGSHISDSESGPAWYKYFLCGVKGALEAIPRERAPVSIFATVWGSIPPNSGLSSSSALVSAALLSIVHASKHQLSRHQLATISAQAERHIGTQGGGMDQAIAFLAKEGSAKLIEFNPLRAADVTLPEDAVFVILHSQVYHNKASTTDFNLRVAECRLAAQMIARKRNEDWRSVQRLIDIQERLGLGLDEMVAAVMTDLHEEPYTLDEICECLGADCDLLKRTTFLKSFDAAQTYKLRQRALHVFQEAGRVREFRRLCEEDGMMECEKLQKLGDLMSKSHASLQNLYECSHPDVDAVVERAVSRGAFGARVTGAGWGGCIVALLSRDRLQQFLDFFRKDFPEKNRQDAVDLLYPILCELKPKWMDVIFPTVPNSGATIFKNHNIYTAESSPL